jgi:isoquinoline 1-oxidoreductase subunit beta
MAVAEDLDIPFDERVSAVFPTEPLAAYANWFNVMHVRPEEARGPAVWAGRHALVALGFISIGASASTMALWHPMRVAGASARGMPMAVKRHRNGTPDRRPKGTPAAVRSRA